MENDDVIVCRCMDVTVGEIRKAICEHNLKSIASIRRITTSGMGLCQGRSCSSMIAQILHEEAQIPLSKIIPATVRPPVRPILIKNIESFNEIYSKTTLK